jgi:hypothetical protein
LKLADRDAAGSRMVLAMAAGGLRIHDLAIWSLDGADLGIRGRHNHLHNMSNRESRRRRKAALAALPRFTAKDLIGLRLTNTIDPPWLDELPNPVTLSDLVDEVSHRRAILFQSMVDGTYVPER